MTLDYFYGEQADQFSFYRIPKALFTDEHFKPVSAEAKILYGILLDRMSLSRRNGWLDEQSRVFIIFTVEEVMEAIGCAAQKAVKLLSELENKAGLIERRRQGLGKPNLLYVKNFVPTPKSKFKNDENHNSGMMKIETQEFPKSQCSNTDLNKTDLSDTDSLLFTSFNGNTIQEPKRNDTKMRDEYREIIKENIDYDILLIDCPNSHDLLEEILELMVDVVCSNVPYIRVSRDEKPADVVKSQFLKLNGEHIRFVLDGLQENTTRIRNMRQYLIATLYNAPLTIGNFYRSLVSHDLHGG